MNFSYKINNVNIIIQLITVVTILCRGNCESVTNDSNDCAIIGSHDMGTKDKLIDWSRQRYIERFPWKAVVVSPRKDDCKGTLISSKHVIAQANCVLQGMNPATLQNDFSDLPKRVNIDDKNYRNIDKIYVPKNYNSTHGFDISILEFIEPIGFTSTLHPVVLPEDPLNFYDENSHLVSGYFEINTWTTSMRRVNISVWSNDECVSKTNVTSKNLGCIENRYPKNGVFFDDCWKYPFPKFPAGPYGGPIFYVLGNGSLEIVGIPKAGNCKEDLFFVGNPFLSNVATVKIAFIYTPLVESLPCIRNILSIGCKRDNETYQLENDQDTFVFKFDRKEYKRRRN